MKGNYMTTEILSSTGKLGPDFRDDRFYINGTRPGVIAHHFNEKWNQATRIGENNERTRVVYRGIVTEDVVRNILQNPNLQPQLEVAIPLADYGQNGFLIYLAQNAPEREPLQDRYILQRNEALAHVVKPSNEQRIKTLRQKGFNFVSEFLTEENSNDVSRIQELWGPTFGWDEDLILGLHRRLISQRSSATIPSVWFNGIRDPEGKLVSLVTAERLDIPGLSGNLSLVESTEWVTDPTCQEGGLITANIILLNAQVIQSMRRIGIGKPCLYAETNRSSRSTFAGEGAGLQIPDTQVLGQHVPQVIRQNVSVNDGRVDIPAHKKRDFNFMLLPLDTIVGDYSPRQIDTLLHEAYQPATAA